MQENTQIKKKKGIEEHHKRKQESKHKSGKANVQSVSGAASRHQGSAGKQDIHQAIKKTRMQDNH